MRSFAYCRVSTREQSTEDHYSLDNQETRCRDYIAMKAWRLAKMRKDIASGKSGDGREGFQELLADIQAGRVDVVIVYRLDRLSRNVRDIYDFLDTIRRCNVGFVSVTEGFDTTTAMGRAMLGVAAVFAQLTREMIAENTKDGILRRAEAGLFNGSSANSYGYTYSQELATIVPEEKEAQIVREIFDWYTDNKWGSQKIARVLNIRGVPTKRGGSLGQWNPTSITRILRNTAYCALIRLPQGSQKVGASDAPNQTRLIEANHEPLITREKFEHAQEIIKQRSDLAPRAHESIHLLSGIATCGQCGRNLRAHYQIKTRKDGTKNRFISYHHSNTVEIIGPRACRGVSKSANLLEAAVVEYLAKASESGILEKIAVDDAVARYGDETRPLAGERDKLTAELADIADKFTQWADRLDSGRIDEEQFNIQNRRLLKRKQDIQKRITEIEGCLADQESIEVTLIEVKKALSDFPKVWDALEIEEKREMLRLLVEYLRIYRDRVTIKLIFLPETELNASMINEKKSSKPVDLV